MKITAIALTIGILAYGVDAKPKKSNNWGSVTKRPGSSGTVSVQAPRSSGVKLNTSSLSNPNRSQATIAAAKASAAVPAPAPTPTPAPGKISTASLARTGTPVQAPAPAQPTQKVTNVTVHQTIVNKTVVHPTYSNHRYDRGYAYTPAPVIFVDRRPLFVYHGHNYPVIERGGLYYTNVDGRWVEMAQSDNGWGVVTPEAPQVVQAQEPVQVQAAPVRVQEPVQAPQAHHGVVTVLLWVLGLALFGGLCWLVYVLVRGDRNV